MAKVFPFSQGVDDQATQKAIRNLERHVTDLLNVEPVTTTSSGGVALPIAESDVTNLVTDLAGKSDVGHTHAESDISGLVADLASKADASHTHAESDITGLVADLAGKAAVTHTHAESDITGLVSDLAAKVPTTRTLTAGTGLSGGGDLSADRSFSLANTAVTPGSYTLASITVDAQGRLTAASSGSSSTISNSDLQNSPVNDPGSPTTYDDEFNGSALDAKWVPFVGSGTMSTTVANSSVVITKVWTADCVYGYKQAFSPGSAAFTFETRLNMAQVSYGASVYSAASIGLTDGTRYVFGGVMSDGASMRLGLQYWSTATTFVADAKSFLTLPSYSTIYNFPYPLDLWVRLDRAASSNHLTVSYSANGYDFALSTTYSSVLSGWGPITGVTFGGQSAGGDTRPIKPRWFYIRKIA